MKIVVQRVKCAKVHIDNKLHSEIPYGLLLLVCLENGDTVETLKKAVDKILKLRIFEDENGKMNKDIIDIKGEVMSVSQFTLSWDGKKGNRPSFENAMSPKEAQLNYSIFNKYLAEKVSVKTGKFAASMEVESINDGPVTFHLDF
jgi:D-tyrosyl-tRNA(Tyr) deacylase